MFKKLTSASLCATLAVACSSSAFNSSPLSRSKETKAKPEGENPKPTDVGEGLPGYLTDPTFVSVQGDGRGCGTVTAKAGAVMTPEGNAEDVVVSIFVLPSDATQAAVGKFAATFSMQVATRDDGGFGPTLPICPRGVTIAVSVSPRLSDQELTVTQREGLFDAVFLKIVVSDPSPGGQPTTPSDVAFDGSFSSSYVGASLGPVPGIRAQRYGGVVGKAGSPDTLLVAAWDDAVIYEVDVIRTGGKISGFSGTARAFATTECGVDAGLAYDAVGDLYAVGYPCAKVFVIRAGTRQVDSYPVSAFDSDASTVGGGLGFVPSGYASGGSMRFASWSAGRWLQVSSVQGPEGSHLLDLPGGIVGFVWVPAGAVTGVGAALLVAEWSSSTLALYDVDGNGDPVPATRRPFATGVNRVEGVWLDPTSRDVVFTTWDVDGTIGVVHTVD